MVLLHEGYDIGRAFGMTPVLCVMCNIKRLVQCPPQWGDALYANFHRTALSIANTAAAPWLEWCPLAGRRMMLLICLL